jgi:hypothetical protein
MKRDHHAGIVVSLRQLSRNACMKSEAVALGLGADDAAR